MASILAISDEEKLKKLMTRAIQSGNLNFLIGSGASNPAIKIGGNIEKEITLLFQNGDDLGAQKKIYEFLSEVQSSNNVVISEEYKQKNDDETDFQYFTRLGATHSVHLTLGRYIDFLSVIEQILNERRTDILPKQANIFTTNYDLFVEKAADKYPALKLNDGFVRTCNLKSRHVFSSRGFFNSTYNNGNLYNYKVEIPAINLIKIHGSLSWKKDDGQIIFSVAQKAPVSPQRSASGADVAAYNLSIQSYNDGFAVVLPQKGKFRETVMDKTYYELFRLYANELDKEGTVLIVFGFSFEDEHILDITEKALKNPTLKIIIFAYDASAASNFKTKFGGYSNVDIVAPEDAAVTDFVRFNDVISKVLTAKIEPTHE